MKYFVIRKYNSKKIYQLFATCVFPIHFWTIMMVFRDFNMIGMRTNYWDAFGVMSYALLFALIESFFFFVILVIIVFAIPKKFDSKVIPFQLSLFFLVFSANVAIYKTTRFYNPDLINTFLKGILRFSMMFTNIFMMFFTLMVFLTILFVIIQTVIILKIKIARSFFEDLFERLTVLSTFFVVLDIAGIIIILIRNII